MLHLQHRLLSKSERRQMAKRNATSEMMSLSIQMGMMAAEAQMVVAMRLWGMQGLWPHADNENHRMVAEKSDATLASGAAAIKAVLSGATPAGIALAAIRPVRRKTRSNAKRLSRAKA